MADPVIRIFDAAAAEIAFGTAQVVSGQIPGTPTAFVQYELRNEGPGPVDTAFNVVAVVTGRLVSVGGDNLGRGVTYVDESAVEIQLIDSIGGATISAIQPAGADNPLFLGNLDDGDSVFFQARVNGATETAQVELVLTVVIDAASSPVGDDVGTGSGIYWGGGDGKTSDWWMIEGSVAAAGSPDETFALPPASWIHLGEVYQELAATVTTPVEDGAEAALSPADATQAYGIRVSAGRVVELADVWSVTIATAAVSADNTLGDATSKLTAGVDWVRIGAEIHLVKTVTDDDNIVLETNHVAGAAAVPMSVPYTLQRGLQAATPLVAADFPAVPVGELEVATVQREGDDTIEAPDITEAWTEGFFSHTSVLLTATIGRGRAKVHAYAVRPQTSNNVTIIANSTNLIQVNGPNNAALQNTTDGSRFLGTMPLYEDTTDGTEVTATKDLRQFLGEQRASVSLFDMTGIADLFVWANPLSAPIYVKPASILFALAEADPSALGWASGAWIIDISVLDAGVQTSIFLNQGTDDQRPTIAFDATSGVATAARHERIRLEGGQSLVVRLAAIPGTPGTDPAFATVGWAWSPAR